MEAKELCEEIKNFCRNRKCEYCPFLNPKDDPRCCFEDSMARTVPTQWEFKVQDVIVFDC